MTFDHTYASAIVDAQKNHKRKEADHYPTPPDATAALMEFLQLPRYTQVWEPTVAEGMMAKVIERYCPNVRGSDLREDGAIYGERGVDFLAYEVDPFEDTPDWIITNPPFNVAEGFIRKALEITPNVAMLLKSQYWHAASRLPLFTTHQPSHVLPLTWRPAFLEAERGRSPLMDVIWVVWRGKAATTTFQPLPRPRSTTCTTDPFGDLL